VLWCAWTASLAYPGTSVPKGCSVLRRFLPAATTLLGLLVVALGIASATLWKASSTVHAVVTPTGGGNVVITAPGVLDLVAPDVTIRASAPGSRVVLAIGRDTDVAGWAAGSSFVRVTGLSSWTRLATEAGPTVAAGASASPTAGAGASASPTAGASASATATARSQSTSAATADPAVSDNWLVQAGGDNAATLTWSNRPGRWSVLAASVGDEATMPELELSWPHPVGTPWLVPAIALGGALLVAGLGLLSLQVLRARSPQLVEAWRTGVPVPAGAATPSGGVPDAAPAHTEQGTLTRRQLRERERSHQDVPVVATPGRLARLRARMVTSALALLSPATQRVATPTPSPLVATPTPSVPAPGRATSPSSQPSSLPFPGPAAPRPAAPAPAPVAAAARWGAPPPDSQLLPVPPAPVAPVAGAPVENQSTAASIRADAWRRAWGFPGIASGTENATEDTADQGEGR